MVETKMKQKTRCRFSFIGRSTLLVIAILFTEYLPTSAQKSPIPLFDALHLGSWTPKNDFRPIQNLGSNGSASFGFNEAFIWGYIQSQGTVCSDCSTNSPAVPLPAIQSYLSVLAQSGIHVARDIVPERYVSDPSKYPLAATVLKEYQNRNFTTIVSLAWPVADLLGRCFGTGGTSTVFDHAAYNYSAAAAKFLLYMKGRSDIDQNWLATRLLIEPWNEFDGICNGSTGSPEKAARYQGIMQMVFDSAGIKNEVLMPSIVNVYKGKMSGSGGGMFSTLRLYLNAYYASGGSGRPNIHIYFNPNLTHGVHSIKTIPRSGLESVGSSVPPPYKNTTIIGEIGVATSSTVPKCNANALQDVSRAILYTDVIKSRVFNRKAQMILFWRLFGLAGLMRPVDACDQFYGVTNNAWPGVRSPAGALGTFSQTGRDMLKVIGHQ
jgi:hypothetical protein